MSARKNNKKRPKTIPASDEERQIALTAEESIRVARIMIATPQETLKAVEAMRRHRDLVEN